MEEIQENDYVKTTNGLIGKVNKIEKPGSGNRFAGEFLSDTIIQFNDGKVYERRVKRNQIKKHSKNIIDLVEVGDIVNGKIVKHIALFEGFPNYPKLIFTDEKHLLPHETCENDDIKTILTHQQYENNIYRIGE